MGLRRSSGTDPHTRTARAIRRGIMRWFALLSAGWVIVGPLLAVVLVGTLIATLVAGALALALTILIGGIGIRRQQQLVAQLDEERHGLREAFDRARLDSLRDGLTGLGNHRAFQEELDEQIAVAKAHKRPFAVVFVDVDNLKQTNDTRGHAAGDELLRAASRILSANLRRSDRGFRVGGDEFALLLLDSEPDEALTIGRRILASTLSAGNGLYGVDPFSVTIGVSAFPALATERQQLLHQADAALYWGKRHGRTDVQLFDPVRHGMAEDWRTLEELAAAVVRVASGRLLTPVYQPIYSLTTGEVLGYEGLVRPRPDAGFANPAAMFVAAESTGRTVELDIASLETVMAGARDLDPRLYLSVNLSPRTLETEAFNPYELLALARRFGIDAPRIVVELTEREAVEDLGRLRSAMSALRRHGVRTAADDVGAGNAGLRLLSEVEFDVMKIDLSLVRAGASAGTSDAVLRALGDLALRRHQTIVAEGVETPQQLEVVMSLGFDSAQGYLLQRPAPGLNAVTLDLPALAGHQGGGLPAAVPFAQAGA